MNTAGTANPRIAGFTLLELMVVVALAAIIATIGLPALNDLTASQRARAAASALYDSLLLGRSEALKRNTAVSMTVSGSPPSLSNGWTMETTPGATLLRTQEPFAGLQFNPPNPTIGYNRLGRLSQGGGTEIAVTSPSSTSSWCVTVDPVGRPRVVEGSCP